MERRGTRRKSLSLGEGDILNSTTDVPPTFSTDRFSNFNPDRCVLGLGAFLVERSFFPENERNDQERPHRSEKKTNA